jgi:MFS family permease
MKGLKSSYEEKRLFHTQRKTQSFLSFFILKRGVNRNLPIIYATSALTWGRLFVPVLALFYIASQVTLQQFTIIMAAFALATILSEIPSGIAADYLGKKKTLLIARGCFVIEVLLLAFTNGFWPLLIAQVIAGIGVSLSSGTKSSLLYETLRKTYKEHQYTEIKAVQDKITIISQGLFFILGAWLFTISPKLPAKISLLPITAGFVLTFFLEEPFKPHRHVALSSIGRHFEESISYLRRHRYVKYLIFYSMPLTAAITIVLTLSSVYLAATKIPIWLIGLIVFLMTLITMYGGKQAIILERVIGEKTTLKTLPFILIALLLLLSLKLPYVSVLLFFLICFFQGFLTVVLDNYVQRHIESSHRVTLMSMRNIFTSLALIILFPIIGFVAGMKLGFAFALLAVIFTIYMIGFFLIFTRKQYYWN